MRPCKDCVAAGVTTERPAPYPGPRCATHHREAKRARRAKAHERRVRAVYGLGEGDYARLYAYQEGRCAGCRRATGATKRLAVDHNHVTGAVRGLLCGPCNQLVGHFRDDPLMFVRLADYLTDPPADRALGIEPSNEHDEAPDGEADSHREEHDGGGIGEYAPGDVNTPR